MRAGCVIVTMALVSFPRAADRVPEEYRIGGFAVGCQMWSFNRFTLFEGIEMTAQAGGRVVEFYPGQRLEPGSDVTFDHDAPDEVLDRVKAELARHHLLAVNYAVVDLPNDEVACRKVFEFARKMGLLALTSEPDPAAMDVIEKLVKEYDIKVAVHNHPRRPDDPHYKVWDPRYVLSIVNDRDPRIGACADTGHWNRSGLNPVECLKILEGRVISVHLKDLDKPDGHGVPWGTGISDVKAILDELKRQRFDGNISVEYEHNVERSLPEITRCIDFVKEYVRAKN
jgi:sugar phosphate isomerase/epimerase